MALPRSETLSAREGYGDGFFTPYHEPSSRDPTTAFPLDGIDLATVSDEQLLAISETAPVLHRIMSTHVVRLSKALLLKFGESVRMPEIEAMRLVLSRTTVATPRVHRYFFTKSESRIVDQCGYLVMDYIEGKTVEEIWDTVSHEQRTSIVSQVAGYVSQLRSIHFDEPGPLGGGKCRGFWFSMYEAGPFTNRAEFNAWFTRKLQMSKKFGYADKALPDFDYSTFVLLHNDLQPKNLILDCTGKIWIIDWGEAGAYPAIFEAAYMWAKSISKTKAESFERHLLPYLYDDPTEREHLMGTRWAIATMGYDPTLMPDA